MFADQLMYTGFAYATRSGVSVGVDDMVVPQQKGKILASAEREVKEIQEQYSSVSLPTVSATTRSSIFGRVLTIKLRRP